MHKLADGEAIADLESGFYDLECTELQREIEARCEGEDEGKRKVRGKVSDTLKPHPGSSDSGRRHPRTGAVSSWRIFVILAPNCVGLSRFQSKIAPLPRQNCRISACHLRSARTASGWRGDETGCRSVSFERSSLIWSTLFAMQSSRSFSYGCISA